MTRKVVLVDQVKVPWGGGGGGVLPYMGYIGMCGAKGYGFLVASLQEERASERTARSLVRSCKLTLLTSS